jgi:hypothetical protein
LVEHHLAKVGVAGSNPVVRSKRTARQEVEMWTCPDCGRRFTGRNMWHSCVTLTVEDHLARVPSWVGDLYRGFESMVERCGPVDVVPVKTYISFMVRVRFAFAIPQQRALRVRLEMPRQIDSPRIVKTESYGDIKGNYLRIVRPDQLDDELADWVGESYAHGARERASSAG